MSVSLALVLTGCSPSLSCSGGERGFTASVTVDARAWTFVHHGPVTVCLDRSCAQVATQRVIDDRDPHPSTNRYSITVTFDGSTLAHVVTPLATVSTPTACGAVARRASLVRLNAAGRLRITSG